MYKIINKLGVELADCQTLDLAMDAAKRFGFFVTIKGSDFEVCGMFGGLNIWPVWFDMPGLLNLAPGLELNCIAGLLCPAPGMILLKLLGLLNLVSWLKFWDMLGLRVKRGFCDRFWDVLGVLHAA